MENELQEKQKEEGFNGITTPAHKMAGDMNLLKSAAAFSDLDPEQAKQAEEQIKNLASSVLSSVSGNVSPEKLKENSDILKGLSEKGYGQAGEVLSQMDEALKQTTGVGLDTAMQMAGGLEKTEQKGHLKETLGALSNFGKGAEKEQEKGAISKNAEQGGMADFMAQKYGANSADRLKFNLTGGADERNEGYSR